MALIDGWVPAALEAPGWLLPAGPEQPARNIIDALSTETVTARLMGIASPRPPAARGWVTDRPGPRLRLNERQYLARIEGRDNDTLEGDLHMAVAVSGSLSPNYAGGDPGDLADKRDFLFTSSTFSDEVTVILIRRAAKQVTCGAGKCAEIRPCFKSSKFRGRLTFTEKTLDGIVRAAREERAERLVRSAVA